MTQLTPREIVSELDRFIIGQNPAKRAVAVALRNRWRCSQLDDDIRNEIYPKNILMIGPTGVGKTEISRRLARLAKVPFIKVEATKYTEVGYVGRDVEQIVRDLLDITIVMVRKSKREAVRSQVYKSAENRVLDALCGENSSEKTRDIFRKKLHAGLLDDKEIELELADNSNPMSMLEIPNSPGNIGDTVGLGDFLSKITGSRLKRRKLSVAKSYEILINEEADKLLDQDGLMREAIEQVEQNGIVFLDEIDKICARADSRGIDVSREGVQRDLLSLIEGTSVSTKHGTVKTDHILFIASGAFHAVKPSDLLPELQGRLPIRVELRALNEKDFIRILTETENALTRQYQELMQTEEVKIDFTSDGIEAIANIAAELNRSVENIGARRLYTVIERVFEDLSFNAADILDQSVIVDKTYVMKNLGELIYKTDVSRYLL